MPTTVYHDSTLSFLPPQWNVNQEYFSFPAGTSSSTGSSSSESSCHEDSRSPLRSPDTTTAEEILYGDKPYLQILEEPLDKYRFRYRTEMQGAHGALQGVESLVSRMKTYPRVKLCNYKGNPQDADPIIRCTLYTADADYSKRVPHVHRLVCKNSSGQRQESDDPHDFVVRQPNYTATFHQMTILFTKKEEQIDSLVQKKQNHARRRFTDGKMCRTINVDQLRAAATDELSMMNLNKATLRFEALIDNNQGQYVPLCPPVYSTTISNIKNPKTNELRICRVDKHRGCCDGKDEVFIFVEKVIKKDIKVKFYEQDENGLITWSSYAEFNPENDVHHQFGIVFSTPPYKDPNITDSVTVNFQLERPSDKAVSAPIPFDYTPNRDRLRNLSRKRPKRDDCVLPTTVQDLQAQTSKVQGVLIPCPRRLFDQTEDLSKFWGNSALVTECQEDELLRELFDLHGHSDIFPQESNILPEVAEQRTSSFSSNISFNQLLDTLPSTESEAISQIISYDRFEEYAQLCGQEEAAVQLKQAFGTVPQVNNYSGDLSFDGIGAVRSQCDYGIKADKEKDNLLYNLHSINAYAVAEHQSYQPEMPHNVKKKGFSSLTENNIIESIEKTVTTLIKLKHSRKISESQIKVCLVRLFSHAVGDLDDSVLHILAAYDTLPMPSQTTKFFNVLKMYEANKVVINVENAKKETPLHVAASRGSPQMISMLLDAGAEIDAVDVKHNTPSHLAIMREEKTMEAMSILLCKLPDLCVTNEDGFTVLHLAVKQRKSDIISSLIVKSEDHYSTDPINEIDRKNGNTALHIAVQSRFIEVVNILLQSDRIDINKKNFAGKTPLALLFGSADQGAVELMEILIANGANPALVEGRQKEESKYENYEANENEEEEFIINEINQEVDDIETAYAREWGNTGLFDKPTINKLCPLLDEFGGWKKLAKKLKYSESEITYCSIESWSPTLLAFKLASQYKPHVSAETIRDQLLTMGDRYRRGAQYIDDMLLRKLGLN